MSIRIEKEKCVGCSSCVEVCPGNLLFLRQGKAFIREVRDCWGCTGCVKACPVHAIQFFLGADIGGRGASLAVEKKGNISIWKITKTDGSVQEISLNSQDANKY